jgi:hypothetical protein
MIVTLACKQLQGWMLIRFAGPKPSEILLSEKTVDEAGCAPISCSTAAILTNGLGLFVIA